MTTLLDIANMCACVYADDPSNRSDAKVHKATLSRNFKLLESAYAFTRHERTGFEGGIFECGQDWVVVFRGTKPSDKRDIKADLEIGLGDVPGQFHQAIQFFEMAKRIKGDYRLYVAGHSLGGGLAQLVSAHTTYLGITFNAPGMKKLAQRLSKQSVFGFHSSNCLNVVLKNDPVSSFGTLLGKTLKLSNPGGGFIIGARQLKAHKQATVVSAVTLSPYHWRTPDEIYKMV
jgi:hypothetical protein